MAERRSNHDEWNLHKEEIHKLYMEDGRKLSDVAALMKARHGFKRTKSQYERVVKKWGMKKYDTKDDWILISALIKDRKNQGRESIVKIRGALVPMAKVKKQISRHEYLLAPYRAPTFNRNMTPPHIRIYTPPRSPEPISTTLVGPLCYPDSVQMPVSIDMFIAWSKCTPWYEFMQFIRMWTVQASATIFLNQCPVENLTSNYDSRPASTGPADPIFEHEKSKTQVWIEDVSMSFWIKGTHMPTIYTSLNSYLPPSPDGSVDINMERFYDISQRSTQLECIKLAVNLISNNHDTWRTLPVIVELAKDKSNLLILKGLFKQKLLILDAVAEKLLYAAAEYRNLPLLRTLVDIGWNIDSVEDDLGYRALSCAVRNGDEDMVMFLLDRGAKTINYYWVFQKGVYESILDLAVERGKINMIKDILTPRPNCRSDCPNITTHTLYLAVILGDINIMNLLVDRNPSLLDNINSKPWLLSEAAAIHGTVSILTHLQSWNIDIAATNASGKGSALAVACYRANMPLIYLLIDSGADVDGVVLGFCQHDEFPGVFPLEEKLNADITAKSALHIAVEMDHKDLVQFLLDRGADPNQCCCAFPLQLATVNGNNTVVKMLLAAGANLDSVHDINKGNYRYSGTFWGPSFEKPAVQLALERGFESIFFTLVEGGAEIPCGHSEAAVRDAKWNPLQSALIGKNKHLVHFILKRAGYSLRGTRVCLARCLVQFGFVLTKTLIDHGIFAAKALHDPIVLCNSVEKGDIELVQSLVLDTKLSLGELPPGYGAVGLALAVRLQKENIVKFFLDVGVKPYDFADLNMQRVRDHDSRDDWQFGWKFELLNGTNALQEAFRLPNDNSRLKRSRNLCCPKILLDECGEVLKDMKQITQNRGILSAYGEAIATGRTDMVNIILDTRLDVRAIDETIGFGGRDEPRRSSLQRLLFSSSFQRYGLDGSRQTYEVAKTLLEHGAVPDCLAQGIHRRYDAGIQTPLQYAAQISGTSLVTKLLAMGADVNAKPNIYKGATALQYAAINGNFEILNILLEAGANINALPASCEGRSAIEGASEWGRLDMVTYLLEAGANVQGRANKNYRRSVYRAWKAGYRYLASKIQEWKTERFGADDCEAIDTIMESMTEDELNFVDLDAKARLKELYPKKFHR